MKICEYCNKEHNENYGSGRFCNSKCARGFSTKNKRKEINEKVSKKLKKIQFVFNTCINCKCSFETKNINKKFCTNRCSAIFNNKNRIIKQSTREKLSKILTEQYRCGKKIKGGKAKWYDIKCSKGMIRVQGTYELNTVKILDNWKKNKKIYDWEYTKDRYEYVGVDDKTHLYLIDFKIYNNKNNFYYLEVKGWTPKIENDKFKWQAVRNLGYRLDVWRFDDIKKHMAAIV